MKNWRLPSPSSPPLICAPEDLIRAVKENLPYINEPVKANFEAFVYEAELINANLTSAINSLKMKIPNRVFHEWCNILIRASLIVP